MQKKILGKTLEDKQHNFSFVLYQEKSIGKGGFGSCYLGWSPQMCQIVAVKCIKRQHRKYKPQHIEQLYNQEINFLSLITNSSNKIYQTNNKISYFVEVYPFKIKSQSNFYIIMEYCQGGSLKDILQKRRQTQWFSFSQLLLIMQHLLEGCQAMRGLEIVHNDLRPENILCKKGIFKIADFGLAKSLKKLEPGRLGGTPPYIPPEKVKAGYTLDYSTDIYALGVIFYYLVYDNHPYFSYEEIISNWDKLYTLVAKQSLMQRKCLIRNIDSHSETILQDILRRMVDKDPKKRPTIQQISLQFRKNLLSKQQPKMKFQYPPLPMPQDFMLYVTEQSEVITQDIKNLIINNKSQSLIQKSNPKLQSLKQKIQEQNWKAKSLGQLYHYLQQYSNKDQQITKMMPKIIGLFYQFINYKLEYLLQIIAKLPMKDKQIFYDSILYSIFNVLKNDLHHFRKLMNQQVKDFKVACINMSKTIEAYLKGSIWLSEQNYRAVRALLLIKQMADKIYEIKAEQLAEVTNQIVNKNNPNLDIGIVLALTSPICQLAMVFE